MTEVSLSYLLACWILSLPGSLMTRVTDHVYVGSLLIQCLILYFHSQTQTTISMLLSYCSYWCHLPNPIQPQDHHSSRILILFLLFLLFRSFKLIISLIQRHGNSHNYTCNTTPLNMYKYTEYAYVGVLKGLFFLWQHLTTITTVLHNRSKWLEM